MKKGFLFFTLCLLVGSHNQLPGMLQKRKKKKLLKKGHSLRVITRENRKKHRRQRSITPPDSFKFGMFIRQMNITDGDKTFKGLRFRIPDKKETMKLKTSRTKDRIKSQTPRSKFQNPYQTSKENFGVNAIKAVMERRKSEKSKQFRPIKKREEFYNQDEAPNTLLAPKEKRRSETDELKKEFEAIKKRGSYQRMLEHTDEIINFIGSSIKEVNRIKGEFDKSFEILIEQQKKEEENNLQLKITKN